MSTETRIKCDYAGHYGSKVAIADAVASGWWEISETALDISDATGEYSVKIRRMDGLHDAWPDAKHSCQSHLSSVAESLFAAYSDSLPRRQE